MSATGTAKQVISISPQGVIQSLRKKKGQGIDLRTFGNTEVERVSEVLFDDTAQKFYVKFLVGMLAGRKLTYTLYSAATGKTTSFSNNQPVMFFDDYEDGVQAEVEVLDAIRKVGLILQPIVLDILSPITEI